MARSGAAKCKVRLAEALAVAALSPACRGSMAARSPSGMSRALAARIEEHDDRRTVIDALCATSALRSDRAASTPRPTPSDAAATANSTVKQRAVFVGREDAVIADPSFTSCTCCCALSHGSTWQLPIRCRRRGSLLAALAPYVRPSVRRAARRYSVCGELGGRRLEQPLARRSTRRAQHHLASSVTA